MEEPQFRITPFQQMLSSCTGALLTSVVVTPLDVVKIRLQSQQNALMSNKCFLYCNGLMDHICHCVNGKVNAWVKKPGHYTSTADAFMKIIRNEGPLSLWSGLPPTLVMAVPATMAYFVSYEQLRIFMKDEFAKRTASQEQPLLIPLIAGGLARTGAVTIVNPLELIRTKMQSKKLTYAELKVACRSLYEVKGIRGFWLGWTPTIIRDVPFSAIYWVNYEALKKAFGQQESPSLLFSFCAGATAGTIAGTVTLPFDYVKTLKQIELGNADFSVKEKKFSTSKEIVMKTYRTTGVNGFFTGLLPRIIKVAPACAIMISTYEYGKAFFSKYNREKVLSNCK